MSVSGDDGDGEGEEPSVVVEGAEEESSGGPGKGCEGSGEEIGEVIEGEMAQEEGREETGGTNSISVSI